MKTKIRRLTKLEQKAHPSKHVFVYWKGKPWTREQMADIKRRHPEGGIFLRSLLESFP
jgi:hypothetical protein